MKFLVAFLVMTTSIYASDQSSTDYLVLGGGCFWCVEAVYEKEPGVISVVSGFAGGQAADPSYEEVVRGKTGHAEVVKIEFDPGKTSARKLLDHFWLAHDPTTKNRQGADVGPQYRSIILPRNEEQAKDANASLEAAKSKFSKPIVTEITPLDQFYPAEKYHQDFYRNNPAHPYNRAVIAPKLKKLGKGE